MAVAPKRGESNGKRQTFSGLVFFCARFIVRDDEAIMCVILFMALLAWICADDSSAMSAIWSICAASACLESSIFAFW